MNTGMTKHFTRSVSSDAIIISVFVPYVFPGYIPMFLSHTGQLPDEKRTTKGKIEKMADELRTTATTAIDKNSSIVQSQPGSTAIQPPALAVPALDIFRASQLGDLARVQQIISEFGPQILLECDERGHTAVHWACLAGHNDILRYYIQCNAPLDKASSNELAPKPIHWACVNGHILTVDLLVQHGVSINTTDSRGCTPLILATQYGQSLLVGYLIGKGARKDFTDVDGDNALHWAAFKGHTEIAQMLIHTGYNSKQKDDVGQTPMHLACLSGKIEMVRMIYQQKPDIYLKDNNGKTPLDLAKGRNYQDIVLYLGRYIKMDTYCVPYIKLSDFLGERRQLVFYMACIFLLSFPLYLYHFQFLRQFQVVNTLFLLLNPPMWYLFYKASKADPGYLQKNTDDYESTLKQVSLHKEWEKPGPDNPLVRLCHTCRLVRPRRAKHCRICQRCIDCMDHHCNFIHNCVGPKNRVAFLLYLFLSVFESYLCVYMMKLVLEEYGFTFVRLVFLVLYGFFVPLVSCMLFTQLFLICFNLTTNEKINIERYSYLKDENGDYFNPYDRGVVKNCLEFLNVIPPVKLGIDQKSGELFSV